MTFSCTGSNQKSISERRLYIHISYDPAITAAPSVLWMRLKHARVVSDVLSSRVSLYMQSVITDCTIHPCKHNRRSLKIARLDLIFLARAANVHRSVTCFSHLKHSLTITPMWHFSWSWCSISHTFSLYNGYVIFVDGRLVTVRLEIK